MAQPGMEPAWNAAFRLIKMGALGLVATFLILEGEKALGFHPGWLVFPTLVVGLAIGWAILEGIGTVTSS